MIEFRGQISEKNQIDRLNKVDKLIVLIFLITMVSLAVIAISVAWMLNCLTEILTELLVCEAILVIVVLSCANTPKNIALRFKLAPHIIITNETVSLELWKNGNKVWRKRKLSRIKKILDYGEIYYIIFKFGDITNAWLCQKDLLVQGTIEEFEQLFEGLIVRKTK